MLTAHPLPVLVGVFLVRVLEDAIVVAEEAARYIFATSEQQEAGRH